MAPIRPGLLVFLSLVLMGLATSRAQAPDTHEQVKNRAQSAAVSWLALADDARGDESWEATAESFRQRVAQEGWATTLGDLRDDLGSISSRSLVMAQFRRGVEGASGGGPFVLLKFRSTAEETRVQELVLMVKEDDAWAVTGYQVTPL